MTAREHVRTRTCVGCRLRAGPEVLVRIAAARDGTLGLGPAAPGRGAWVCGEECFERATARGRLGQALRRPLTNHEVADLRARLSGARSER